MQGRRRMHSARSAKRPTEWITKQSSAVSDTWAGNTSVALTTNTAQVFGPLVSSSAGSTGGVSFERFRIERVIGTIGLINGSSVNANCSMGMYIGDFQNGALADLWDPTIGTDASKSWLWLMQQTVPGSAIGAGSQYTLKVDVRVKRIIRAQQELVLVMKSNAAANALSTVVNLRTLVSRAI